MKILLNTLALAIALLTVGCAMSTSEMRRVSMGQVACNPRDEILIHDAVTDRRGDARWLLSCGERSYNCARVLGSSGQAFLTGHRSENYSCTEH